MTMMKEIKDTSKQKDIPRSWIGGILLECPYPQSNLQTEHKPYQNPNGIFQRNRTNNPKICMEQDFK